MEENQVSLATVTTTYSKSWSLTSFIVCFPHALNSLLSHHLSASVRRGVQSAHRPIGPSAVRLVVVATLMPLVDSAWQHAAYETCGSSALHQQKAHCETTTATTTAATMQ